MISFMWWWLLLLWPLYFVLNRLIKARPMLAPSMSLWVDANPGKIRSGQSSWVSLLLWSLLVVAVARPVSLGEAAITQTSGRDLQLAIDISSSMLQDDFVIGNQRVSRLHAIKAVAHEFIAQRAGDRVGLILYADQAYVHTPLSYDIKAQQALLLEAEVGLAGKKTAIGDAIALAVKRLRDKPTDSRVLVLLSDGVNNAGEISPEQAVELARYAEVRIHTIAVGLKRGFFTSTSDTSLLKFAAEQTGGRFYDAANTNDLVNIYREIDQLEPSVDPVEQRRREEWFWLPLAAFMAIALVRLYR